MAMEPGSAASFMSSFERSIGGVAPGAVVINFLELWRRPSHALALPTFVTLLPPNMEADLLPPREKRRRFIHRNAGWDPEHHFW